MYSFFLALLLCFNTQAQMSDLFFTEYVEGSSNNKALEIYNGTSNDILLDNYRIITATNGKGWNTDFYTFLSGTILKAGDVFVIANNQSNENILAIADQAIAYNQLGYVVSFNGNDARALVKVSGESETTIIDVIGDHNSSANIDVAGVVGAGVDHSLVRKLTVTSGNSNWALSAGTNGDDSEWIVKDKDDISNLGKHGEQPVTPDIAKIVINELMAKASAGSDWIELFNPTTTELNIGGLYITDDLAAPMKWQIPTTDASLTTIPANGFLVLFADEETTSANHIGFNLSKDGESVALYMTDGATVIDQITFGAQTEDISYGRFPDGASTWFAMTEPTPGSTNKKTETLTRIYDIQFTADASGDSPLKGSIVTTSGIVTASHSNGYYIQDGKGEWSGVYVYDKVNKPTKGDLVVITASVAEYNNLTELTTVTSYSITSSGNTIPDVTVVSQLSEAYEGVLVKMENIFSSAANDGNGNLEFKSADASVVTLVHNQLYSDFTPILDNNYNITGVVNYAYSAYKIEPRSVADIVDLTATIVPVVFINEFIAKATDAQGNETSDWVELYNPTDVAIDLAGMFLTDKLTEPTQWQFPTTNSTLTTIPANGFLVVYLDGTSSDEIHTNFKLGKDGEALGLYTAEGIVIDSTSFGAQEENVSYNRFPDGGTTWRASTILTPGAANQFPVEVTSIYDIQYTTDETGNSPFNGQTVVTEGIVTAIVMKNDALSAYYIQSQSGAWNGIYVYDNKNAPTVGDNITIKAEVTEYYNLTELKNVSSFTINSSGNALPEPVVITPAQIGEQYEGVLVKVENVTCTNVDFDGHKNSTYSYEGGTEILMAHTQMYVWEPGLNAKYTFTGIINYDFSNFKIEPRNANDIVEISVVKNPPVVGTVVLEPTEPIKGEDFVFAVGVTDDIKIESVVLTYGTSQNNLTETVNLDKLGFSSNYGFTLKIGTIGTIYYKIVATDSDGLTAETTGSFVVTEDTKVDFVNDDIQISLYPNPAHDELNVVNIQDVNRIEINNITGKKVIVEYPSGVNEMEINISDLHSGIYLMMLEKTNGDKKVMKFIKR